MHTGLSVYNFMYREELMEEQTKMRSKKAKNGKNIFHKWVFYKWEKYTNCINAYKYNHITIKLYSNF